MNAEQSVARNQLSHGSLMDRRYHISEDASVLVNFARMSWYSTSNNTTLPLLASVFYLLINRIFLKILQCITFLLFFYSKLNPERSLFIALKTNIREFPLKVSEDGSELRIRGVTKMEDGVFSCMAGKASSMIITLCLK